MATKWFFVAMVTVVKILSSSAQEPIWANCGNDKILIPDLEQLQITPYPVRIPGSMTVSIAFKLLEDYDMSTATVRRASIIHEAPFLGMIDLCRHLLPHLCQAKSICKFAPHYCEKPLKAGDHVLNIEYAFLPEELNLNIVAPNSLIAGDYEVRVEFRNGNVELACIVVQFEAVGSNEDEKKPEL